MGKNATQSQTRLTNINPADQMEAGPRDQSSAAGVENDQDLAELVWKYFGEEFSETLKEVQQALALEKGRSATGKSLEG